MLFDFYNKKIRSGGENYNIPDYRNQLDEENIQLANDYEGGLYEKN